MQPSPKSNETTLNIRKIFALLGILLILIGQCFFFAFSRNKPQPSSASIVLTAVGVILFMLGFVIKVGPALQARIERIKVSQPVFWIVTAAILSVLSACSMVLFMKFDQTVFIPVLIFWFAAGVLYIYAFSGQIPSREQIKTWGKDHRTELLIIAGITLLAAILRLYQLGIYPRILDGDEGLIGDFAESTPSGKYANPFTLWENFGGLYLQAVYVAIRIFGSTPLAIRILPAISGILAIPVLYLFARFIAGKRVAFISSFLLAVSHAHINFSRIGSVGYIHSTWLVPLELYLLLAGLEKRKSWMTAAGGVILAIHFSIYLSSQLIAGVILIFMLIALVFMRHWFLPKIRQAAAFWGGFSIMILPELVYVIRNPNEFFDRLNQNGTFQTGWLAETVARTGQSSVQVLAGRVSHAFLSLIYYPAKDYYGANAPLLTLLVAVFFLAGLGIALLRLRKPGMLLLNGYFWAAPIAIGIFSIPVSADSYRMLIALPPAFLLAAIAVDEFLEAVGAGWNSLRRVYILVSTGLLICITIFSLWVYFGDFVGQCRYADNTSRFASYLGTSAASLQTGSTIYLLSDDIYFFGSHPSASFLSAGRTIKNMADPVSGWQGVTGDTLVANPNRITELETWIKTNPGGQANFVYDCNNLILLSYRLP